MLALKRPVVREGFVFEELDADTRALMLREFRQEEAGNPYRSPWLTEAGAEIFGALMEIAISEGNDVTLAESLHVPEYWHDREPYMNSSRSVRRDAYWQLAIGEFNTAYVRGLSRKLLDEGVISCQIYRAAPARESRPECDHLEGQVFLVSDIYAGHRRHYWPAPGDKSTLSIPVGPNCHHTIRRVPVPLKDPEIN